jgi:hypothetical protein
MSAFGVKRTYAGHRAMSAYDPKRTFGPFQPIPTNVPLLIPGWPLFKLNHVLALVRRFALGQLAS